jgi:hypothetical protein
MVALIFLFVNLAASFFKSKSRLEADAHATSRPARFSTSDLTPRAIQ